MKIRNLSVKFDQKTVIDEFNFNFAEGQLYILDGVSGRGKTTLFNVISGVLKSYTGKVDLCGKRVAYMFQEDRLFRDFTVLENVVCVTEGTESNIEISKAILKELGLENEIYSYPDDLSGGMRRRVALARALVYNGDIVLLDEAFKGLDEETCKNAIETVLKYTSGKIVVVAAHMLDKNLFGKCNVINL